MTVKNEYDMTPDSVIEKERAAAQEQYPLPDSLYPGSKDWMAGSYKERVEWLHLMYESERLEAIRLENVLASIKDEPAQQEQPASVDAYTGAREDAAIWKKRALEAEELNRKFIAELNGPTYLGEPAQQEQPAQKPDPVLCKFYQVTTFAELVSAQEHHINKLQEKQKKEIDNGMGSILVRKSRAASDEWSGCTVVGGTVSEPQTVQVITQPALSDEQIAEIAKPFIA